MCTFSIDALKFDTCSCDFLFWHIHDLEKFAISENKFLIIQLMVKIFKHINEIKNTDRNRQLYIQICIFFTTWCIHSCVYTTNTPLVSYTSLLIDVLCCIRFNIKFMVSYPAPSIATSTFNQVLPQVPYSHSMTMMTSSNGNIFRVTGHVCGEFTGPRWISRTKASDAELVMFILICVWINGWVNDREAGDLRRHYDVIVMRTNRHSGC